MLRSMGSETKKSSLNLKAECFLLSSAGGVRRTSALWTEKRRLVLTILQQLPWINLWCMMGILL